MTLLSKSRGPICSSASLTDSMLNSWLAGTTYQELRIIPRNGCEYYSSLLSIFREFKLLGSSSIAFVYASIARSFFPAFEYASPRLS